MANHTSPIDVIILASDGYYAMVRSAPRPQLCLPGPGHMPAASTLHGKRQQEAFEHAELLVPA